jgi:hypothetical protein
MCLSDIPWFGLVTINLLLAPAAAGQELARGDPNQLRDPVMLSLKPAESLRGSVQLLVGEFLRAVRNSDAATLKSLGTAEQGEAVRACLGQSVSIVMPDQPVERRHFRALRPTRATPAMGWGDIDVQPGGGDTLAIATVAVTQRANGRSTTVPMVFLLINDNGATRIARVDGLLATNCGGSNP